MVVVAPTDDVDIATAEAVQDTVVEGVPNWSDGAVLDLSRVRYLDSAGVRIIFTLAHRLRERRQQLRLVATPGSAVERALEISGVVGAVATDDSVDAAVQAVSAEAAPD